MFDTESPKQVLEKLRSFNSKERFFMVGYILGNPDFKPSQTFVEKIENILNLKCPKELFTAMDYHLDWLYASLYLAFYEGQNNIYPNDEKLITGSQEDIDFIIAFVQNNYCHIILIEVKGVMEWANKQLHSKALRLGKIFGQKGDRWPSIVPHFLMMSPKKSKDIDVFDCPSWMTLKGEIPWVELSVPNELYKVTRCDDNGHANKDGAFWRPEFRKNCGYSPRQSV
jgi:hypothetical protein